MTAPEFPVEEEHIIKVVGKVLGVIDTTVGTRCGGIDTRRLEFKPVRTLVIPAYRTLECEPPEHAPFCGKAWSDTELFPAVVKI